MAQTLSKTARASMRVETAGQARTPVAWIFEHKVGKLQTRPYGTYYNMAEAKSDLEYLGDAYYLVAFGR